MALLLLMKSHLAPKQTLTAITVNHALRTSSAAEARQVKSWCKALGIKHISLTWKHGEITSGIQAKARTARYDLMAKWCHKHKVNALLTAHTKEDQAETVAMRMARTNSAKSLSAIWSETEIHGLKVLRPLLTAKREDLRNDLNARGQPWLEDPSNQDPRFERVRLRQAGVSAALAATATKAQIKIKAASAAAQKWIAKNARRDASSMIEFEARGLTKLSGNAQDEALIRLIEAVGGKAPERAKREALLTWLEAPTNARRSLGGAIFIIRKNIVRIGREPARIDSKPVQLAPRKAALWDNRFLAQGPKGSTIISKATVKSLKRIKNLPAFVDLGLPVIITQNQVLATPFFSHHPQAKLTLFSKTK